MSSMVVANAEPGNPWFSWDYISTNSDTLLDALREHLYLTVTSLLIATLIAVPLSIAAYKIGVLTGPILALSGTLYTIPSLALFAFLAPILGIRPLTVIVPLALYAILMIVRGTLTGLRAVPENVRDAARGMGYGPLAMLWRVELALALPSALTGLRVATVSTVALVTVGDIAGFGGFGSLILAGFRNNFFRAEILTATLACVALALLLDALLLLAGRIAMPWMRRQRGAAT